MHRVSGGPLLTRLATSIKRTAVRPSTQCIQANRWRFSTLWPRFFETSHDLPGKNTTSSAPVVKSVSIPVKGPDDTRKLASELSSVAYKEGDVVLVFGNLGVGKTTFAQGFIRGLMKMPHMPVGSPTFTLVITYDHAGRSYHHMDLYRISNPSELESLQIDALFRQDTSIVEWPDRLIGTKFMPASYIRVTIKEGDELTKRVEDVGSQKDDQPKMNSSNSLITPIPPPPLHELFDDVDGTSEDFTEGTGLRSNINMRKIQFDFIGEKWRDAASEFLSKQTHHQ